MQRAILLGLLVAAALGAAHAQSFNVANIVPTLSACPVKNPTKWDPKVFDPSIQSLAGLAALTSNPAVPTTCRAPLLNLLNCVTDGGSSGINSLATSNGCCTTVCATRISDAVKTGCIQAVLKVACKNAQTNAKYQAGLFNAATRCTGFKPSC